MYRIYNYFIVLAIGHMVGFFDEVIFKKIVIVVIFIEPGSKAGNEQKKKVSATPERT